MVQKPIETTNPRSLPSWLTGIVVFLYLALLATLILTPGTSLLDRLRWLDSGVCAQLPTHSFFLGGERLPLCSRNTGIYLGFIVTLISLYATGRGRAQRLPSWSIIITLVTGIAIMGIDGFNSLALDLGLPHLYQPHNLIRLITGLITGLALAILGLPMLNRLFWCEYNEQRSSASWLKLLLLIPALIVCFFAVSSQSLFILYPIAILSTFGILTALAVVNLIVIVAISKRDETFVSYRELLPFFSISLLFAIGEMLTLAQLRLILFHALGI
jgi:uncharacterized membrane protein